MKLKPIFFTLFAVLLLSCTLSLDTYAQGKGKGGPPPWAPAHGYRAKTRHIYFPQHNFYFDVQRGLYIYISGGNWLTAVKLPSLFGRIDLAKATQVELDLTTDHPHKYNADHKVKYKAKHHGHDEGEHHDKKRGKGTSSNGKGKGNGGKGKGKGR